METIDFMALGGPPMMRMLDFLSRPLPMMWCSGGKVAARNVLAVYTKWLSWKHVRDPGFQTRPPTWSWYEQTGLLQTVYPLFG
jgi:hypothetical protein